MKKYLAALALFSTLLFSFEATATVPDGTPIGNETLRPLANWVEQATHVKFRMLPLAVASGMRLKTSLGLEGVQQARSLAAYIPGQIIVNNIIWDPESTVSQSYIVHELVHHAQLMSGKSYPCHAAKEREAYMLQNRWLAEHGESPVVDQSWIDERASCSGHVL